MTTEDYPPGFDRDPSAMGERTETTRARLATAGEPEIWLVAKTAGADTATIYTDLQHRPMTFSTGQAAQKIAEEIGPAWAAVMLRRPQ